MGYWRNLGLWLIAIEILYPFMTVAYNPVCDFIAATNVGSLHSEWVCSMGSLISNPCSPLWSGLICSGSVVVSVTMSGLTGIVEYDAFTVYVRSCYL